MPLSVWDWPMFKLSMHGVALASLLLAMSVAWGRTPPEAQVITEKDRGRTVTLTVGETLILDLRNPASGGYTNISPSYNAAVLQLQSREDIPPARGPTPRLGDFGRIRFTWQAVAPGDSPLVIHISREWEKHQPPLVFVEITVQVLKAD